MASYSVGIMIWIVGLLIIFSWTVAMIWKLFKRRLCGGELVFFVTVVILFFVFTFLPLFSPPYQVSNDVVRISEGGDKEIIVSKVHLHRNSLNGAVIPYTFEEDFNSFGRFQLGCTFLYAQPNTAMVARDYRLHKNLWDDPSLAIWWNYLESYKLVKELYDENTKTIDREKEQFLLELRNAIKHYADFAAGNSRCLNSLDAVEFVKNELHKDGWDVEELQIEAISLNWK